MIPNKIPYCAIFGGLESGCQGCDPEVRGTGLQDDIVLCDACTDWFPADTTSVNGLERLAQRRRELGLEI